MRKLRLTQASEYFGQDHERGGRSEPGSWIPMLCSANTNLVGWALPTSFRHAHTTCSHNFHSTEKKIKHCPLLISLLQLLPQLGPSLHSQTSKTCPDFLSLPHLPLTPPLIPTGVPSLKWLWLKSSMVS